MIVKCRRSHEIF